MDAEPTLAELLISPGQGVTAVGRLGFEEHPARATLWLLPRTDVDGDDGRREGAHVTVTGVEVTDAPRGVPVIVHGTWDGACIRDVGVRVAAARELTIPRVEGDPSHPSTADVSNEMAMASVTAIGASAATLGFGGNRRSASHHVLAVTPELIDVIHEGRVRTEILAAIVPAEICPFSF